MCDEGDIGEEGGMMKILLIIMGLVVLGWVIWVVKKVFKDDVDDEWRGWR